MLIQIILGTILGIVTFVWIFWRFWFLRDPERKIPKGQSIICPADGIVNDIVNEITDGVVETSDSKSDGRAQISKGRLGRFEVLTKDVAKNCTIVSVEMSPMDVHVQRSPIKGTVKSIKYTKGKFMNAMTGSIAIENERNEILIKNDSQVVKVVQIAGALARRIECFVVENQKVGKGERIGRINLGSQVSLILPKTKVRIKKGQRVYAGTTVIA